MRHSRGRLASTAAHATVGVALVASGIGPLVADFVVPATAKQHLRNPAWTPHAKFHDAQYIVMSGMLSALGLRVLTDSAQPPARRVLHAASLAAMPWAAMWGALAFPATAARDPEFDVPAGEKSSLDPQLKIGLGLMAAVAGAVALERGSER